MTKPPRGATLKLDHPLARGLVGCWLFNEGAGDIVWDLSPYKNTGKLNSPVWTAGEDGWALQFDGNDDYMIKNPISNFPKTEITVVFRMKSSDTTKYGTPFSYATSTNNNEFLIFNYRGFKIYIGDNGGDTYYVSTRVSANDGKWHHIVVTWRSSNGRVELFKDGILAYSGTLQAGYTLISGGSLVLGQDQDTVGGGFDTSQAFLGLMAEVRIYNRALSADEIRWLYEDPYDMFEVARPSFSVIVSSPPPPPPPPSPPPTIDNSSFYYYTPSVL